MTWPLWLCMLENAGVWTASLELPQDGGVQDPQLQPLLQT